MSDRKAPSNIMSDRGVNIISDIILFFYLLLKTHCKKLQDISTTLAA